MHNNEPALIDLDHVTGGVHHEARKRDVDKNLLLQVQKVTDDIKRFNDERAGRMRGPLG